MHIEIEGGRWFDTDSAAAIYREQLRWEGELVSRATGLADAHEILYRTGGGAYVLMHEDVSGQVYKEVVSGEAVAWLNANGYYEEAAEIDPQFAAAYAARELR